MSTTPDASTQKKVPERIVVLESSLDGHSRYCSAFRFTQESEGKGYITYVSLPEVEGLIAEARMEAVRNLDRAHAAEEKLDSAIYMIGRVREWAQEDGAVFSEIRKLTQEFLNRYARARAGKGSK